MAAFFHHSVSPSISGINAQCSDAQHTESGTFDYIIFHLEYEFFIFHDNDMNARSGNFYLRMSGSDRLLKQQTAVN